MNERLPKLQLADATIEVAINEVDFVMEAIEVPVMLGLRIRD